MNKNYIRGRNTEYKAKKELEEMGYYCSRSSGSHTKIDLWAVSEKDIKLIQLKRVKGKYYSFKQEIKEIKSIKCPKNCSKELWVWLDRKGWQKHKL